MEMQEGRNNGGSFGRIDEGLLTFCCISNTYHVISHEQFLFESGYKLNYDFTLNSNLIKSNEDKKQIYMEIEQQGQSVSIQGTL